MNALLDQPETQPCSCETCAAYCQGNPGWPTPGEARKLWDAGYGAMLTLEAWLRMPEKGGNIYLLAPARPRFESRPAPGVCIREPNNGMTEADILHATVECLGLHAGVYKGCTFYRNGLCEVHNSGAKPAECRMIDHNKPKFKGTDLRFAIALTWATDEGRSLVRDWCAAFSVDCPVALQESPL